MRMEIISDPVLSKHYKWNILCNINVNIYQLLEIETKMKVIDYMKSLLKFIKKENKLNLSIHHILYKTN